MSLSNFVAAMLTVAIMLSAAFSVAVRHVPDNELHLYGLEREVN